MLLQVPGLLNPAEVAKVRGLIDAGDWADGNATSGAQSALAKDNRQLAEDSPAAREAGVLIREALTRNPLFMSAALPHTVYPPLFNRPGLRRPHRQRPALPPRHRRAHPHRPVGHPLPGRARQL